MFHSVTSFAVQSLRIRFGLPFSLILLSFFQLQFGEAALGNQEAQMLAAGVPVERDLAGGEAQLYSINLAAGQYLEVAFEHTGIECTFSLSGPDGRALAEWKEVLLAHKWQASLSLITQTAGAYKLAVKSLEQPGVTGKYEVRIAELRAAAPQDDNRVAAQKLLAEAREFKGQTTKESRQKAIEKYEQALALWRTAGAVTAEAATLNEQGVIFYYLADAPKTIAAHTQALALWQKAGRKKEEARTLSELGLIAYAKSEAQKALDYYQQALPLLEAAQDRYWEGETLNRYGWVYRALGEPYRALEFHQRALPLRREAGDTSGESVTLNDLGRLYYDLGEMQRAIETYQQALKLRSPETHPSGTGNVLVRLGVVYEQTGERQKALDAYTSAQQLLKRAGDHRAEASVLNNLGQAYANLGDRQRALENYEQSLKLMRELGLRPGEATTLSNLGQIWAAAGERQKAIDFYQQALAIYQSVNNRSGIARALNLLGIAYLSAGEIQKAQEHFSQSLALRQALGERRGQAYSQNNLGVVYRALGQHRKAVEFLDQALALNRAVANREGEAITLHELALTWFALGETAKARTLLEEALKIIESLRQNVVSQELRTSYLSTMQDKYETSVELLMDMHRQQPDAGNEITALQVSERARSRGLLDLLNESGGEIRRGVDPALLQQERALQQRLNARAEAQTALLSGKHTEAQATTLAKEVAELVTQLGNLTTQIRRASPRYAALTQPHPLNATEIQGLLDDETLLLIYALGEKQSYLWLVSPKSLVSHALPPRAEIETAARQVYALLTARQTKAVTRANATEFQTQAAALSQTLLGPVATQLGTKRLAIVASGALAYLPFAALPDPSAQAQPLIVNHEIVNLPSASVLALLREDAAERRANAHSVAVLADPVFTKDDPRLALARKNKAAPPVAATPASIAEAARFTAATNRAALTRLPFSREEADAITALLPAAQTFKAMGFQASRTTVTQSDLSRYRFVHFATHGLLNSVQPELSGLVFSLVDEKGQVQDGMLRLHEIYNLKLNADLVALSACQTALGKEVRGEGLIGLTRGFMYAGAARVLASLWQVDDLATADLMKRFYSGIFKEGLRPAAALRAAQLALLKQKSYAEPFYWAAFVMQGDWR